VSADRSTVDIRPNHILGPTTDTNMSTRINSSLPAKPADDYELTAAWTLQALNSVWSHQRTRVDQRINVIETAVTALENDVLGEDLREDALRATHMLAGSLGTFGFLGASDAARELESGFKHAYSSEASVLFELVRRLRTGVQGRVTLCSQATDA
jgi:HPt (histidine-containing phosphotransfer) domain-containing protein